MSMISEQVKVLRNAADAAEKIMAMDYVRLMREAAFTIEEQDEKIEAFYEDEALNRERSAAHYNGGWVPCADRLPINDGKYIVTNNGFAIPANYCTYALGKRAWFGEYGKLYGVSHWMPLPDPWKGETE